MHRDYLLLTPYTSEGLRRVTTTIPTYFARICYIVYLLLFFSYVLDQILSAEARDTIVENIAEYLSKGINLIVNHKSLW